MLWSSIIWCCIVRRGMVLGDMVLYGVELFGMIKYGVEWYSVVRCSVVCYMPVCGTMRYGIVWCSKVSYALLQYDICICCNLWYGRNMVLLPQLSFILLRCRYC